ncbi:MAG TPA: RidA family protein [Chroococcales cyanobacterium]
MTQVKCDGSRTAIKVVEDAPAPLGAYSHAVFAGDFLYVSGQGARKARTGKEAGVVLDHHGLVVAYDIKVQTRAVLENLKTVLKAAALELTDLVDVSVFLKNMDDFAQYNEVYNEYFSFPDPPARTTVQVAGLPGNNFIEIKAIAYRGSSRS